MDGLFPVLFGGGGDRPALDLNFAGTGAVDSRVTFTRASAGACVTGAGLVASAATNVARMEHDPITGARLGLLIEEARSNPLTFSGDLTNAAWVKFQSSIVPNAGVSPDGLTNAFRLTENSVGGVPHQVHSAAGASGISMTRTMSVWAKGSDRTWLRLNLWTGGANNNQAWFNLGTGALGTVTAGVTSRIRAFANGWYRCELTFTGVYSEAVFGLASADNVKDYAGNGTSGLLLWGPQIEDGAFATSYIATTTAAATRAADVATLSGANFSSWYVQNTGVFACDYIVPNLTNFSRLFSIGPGPASLDLVQRAAPTPQVGFDQTTITNLLVTTNQVSAAGVLARAAVNIAPGAYMLCLNGGTVATSAATNSISANALILGSSVSGLGYINAPLARLRYWPRARDAAGLQRLTA